MIQLEKRDIEKVMDALAIKSWGILNLNASDIEKIVIAVALPYQMESRFNPSDTNLCKVDAFAWSFDYHVVVKKVMSDVISKLEEHILQRFDHPQIYVDQSPYNDQEIGYRAGLGHMGKNHLLINPIYGTHFFIGYVVLSAQVKDIIETEQPFQHPACLSCDRCTRACPAQICTFDHTDMRQCISALTQTKSVLTVPERHLIGRNLYGCNICQKVCPLNQPTMDEPGIYPITTDNWVDAFEILKMTKHTFKEKYGHMGFAWRSLWIYKRNALIVLANSGDVNHMSRLKNYAFLAEDENLSDTYLWVIETLSKKI